MSNSSETTVDFSKAGNTSYIPVRRLDQPTGTESLENASRLVHHISNTFLSVTSFTGTEKADKWVLHIGRRSESGKNQLYCYLFFIFLYGIGLINSLWYESTCKCIKAKAPIPVIQNTHLPKIDHVNTCVLFLWLEEYFTIGVGPGGWGWGWTLRKPRKMKPTVICRLYMITEITSYYHENK